MSVRGSSSSMNPSKKDKGKSPALSKTPVSKSPVTGTVTPSGPLVPYPSYPGMPIPVSSSKFQVLGQIPKPYSSALASQPSDMDPYQNPSKPSDQSFLQKRSDYVVNYQMNLFHIEPSMDHKSNPAILASKFFPAGWHFSPSAPYKTLSYYKDILLTTESINIKPIYDKNDSKKIIFHSLYIRRIITLTDWENFHGHPSNLKLLNKDKKSDLFNGFSYHDYIDAWNKIFLHQNETFSHSWFVQFDHKFKSQIPFWFTSWWSKFGPSSAIFPESLLAQVNYFSCKAKPSQKFEHIPLLLQFVSKYKIPWILRWQYNIHSPLVQSSSQSAGHPEVRISNYSQIPVVSRIIFVKWWDKFDIQRIIGQVQGEFGISVKSYLASIGDKKKQSKSSDSLHLSDIKGCSASELKLIIDAVSERQSELSKPSDEEDEASSSSSSSHSVNQDPCASQFQDAQDPYAS